MTIQIFIKNEVKKYRTKVMRFRNNDKKNLDTLERAMRTHEQNCFDFIEKTIGYENYSECCKWKDIARKALDTVDDEIFGCVVDGNVVGYNFLRFV